MKNKNQPLVSVIINTRNSAGKIFEKCLASVKVQSYKNVELIVVDNSSSDKTKEIAKRYTKKVFDYGPERSSQKNFGVQKSRGEFLVFLDDDQEMPPEIIEDCVKKIKDKKYIFSKKDIIFLEAIKSDGIKISKKYHNLYKINKSEMPADIQSMIDNKEIGAALLRVIEVIGPEKIEDIDDDTVYFIINTLNQLNVDLIRNKLLLKILPLKV